MVDTEGTQPVVGTYIDPLEASLHVLRDDYLWLARGVAADLHSMGTSNSVAYLPCVSERSEEFWCTSTPRK